MTPSRTGIILYVQAYAACVAFYRDVLGFSVLFEAPELTCFAFGKSYLMVEFDHDEPPRSVREPHRTCLRMNVPDVRAAADRLEAEGVAVDYQEHAWGTVAKFVDPDGTLCAFKDDAGFERQVREHTAVSPV